MSNQKCTVIHVPLEQQCQHMSGTVAPPPYDAISDEPVFDTIWRVVGREIAEGKHDRVPPEPTAPFRPRSRRERTLAR